MDGSGTMSNSFPGSLSALTSSGNAAVGGDFRFASLSGDHRSPRVQQAFISIVRVEVTNDLSYCTVQVSAIEGLDRAKEAVKGLKSASGFIRRELGHRLHLRHVPELIFHATDSIEYSANISRILNSLDIKEDEEENDESV